VSVQFDIVSASQSNLLSSCRSNGVFQFSEVEQYVMKNILTDQPDIGDKPMQIISINTIYLMESSIFVFTGT